MEFLMKKLYFLNILVLLFMSCEQKCNTQSKKIEMIEQEVQLYYNSSNKQHLYNAKEYIDSVEQEGHCNYFFDTKVQIYVLLDEYGEAISYIEDIDDSKFNKSYQKKYYLYSLKAKQAAFDNDSILSKEYYGKIIELLQNQVNLEFDEIAFYELYLTKSKINLGALVEKELDSIINEDGQYREIANIIRSSLSHLSSGKSVAIDNVSE